MINRVIFRKALCVAAEQVAYMDLPENHYGDMIVRFVDWLALRTLLYDSAGCDPPTNNPEQIWEDFLNIASRKEN